MSYTKPVAVDSSIDILELTGRLRGQLAEAGIVTLGQLQLKTQIELLKMPNLNARSINQIIGQLESRGLQLAEGGKAASVERLKTTAPPKKKKPIGDVTRTARAGAYLERLEEAKGKRLVVDLNAPGRMALERLLEGGYGDSQKEVVIKALIAADQSRKTGA